ncbi:MAG: tRNA 5-methylaminomethyl-2-thiouridine biosynthesis bifunctional protein MnmC [Pseudorhodoplanes sp.]|nr:tRNA 5-methylaminomethyl-2-thiouridine biosynthesis bifunctional protein MnmC [Pseudorhodoplanes sp.]
MDTADLTQTDDAGAGYAATYFTATMAAGPRCAPLQFDLDVDVCVVGAGLAGLTAAREIARRGRSVAVLEGGRIAGGASGRNIGLVMPGFAQDPRRIVARAGLERARVLWRLSEAGVDYIRDTIAEAGLADAALSGGGFLSVSKIDDAQTVERTAHFLRTTFGVDCEAWPTERVRAHLKSSHYFQAIHFRDAFHIHPLNYALGLARLAEEAGVRIFENTPALAMDPVGVRKRIQTPHARVRAGAVVLAGGVHLGGLMPALSQTLVPATRYVVATAPLGAQVADAIDFAGGIGDGVFADSHYRLAGDRLIWSGGLTVREANARRVGRRLRRDIGRIFPQLGKVEIESAWAGTFGYAVHRMPQVGEMVPGVWIASGFGQHGLNTTAMAGNILARAIVEGSRTWLAFEPFELIWAGGSAGRLVARLQNLLLGGQERMAARLSRRRERVKSRYDMEDAQRAQRLWAQIATEPSTGEPLPAGVGAASAPAAAEAGAPPMQPGGTAA